MAATALGRGLGKLLPNTSALFVCDIQERFRPVIHQFPTVLDTSRRMARAAGILGVPVVGTEQYPKALGATCAELAEAFAPGTPIVAKTMFSMLTPEVDTELKKRPDVRQVMLLGIEAHVCVLQTTLDLLEKGYEVHLLVDGISSQRPHDRAVALQRMAQAGALLSSSEMAMFQLMGNAKHEKFKAVSALVKEERPVPIPGSLL